MALVPKVSDYLLSPDWTSDEQYALLGRFGCLSSWGLADRAAVIRLLTRVRTAYRPTSPGPLLPPGDQGDPSLADEFDSALFREGYLDTDVWAVVRMLPLPNSWPPVGDEEFLGRLESRLHAALNPVPPTVQDTLRVALPNRGMIRTELINCPTCQQGLPAIAVFCGRCGRRL